MKTAAIIGAGVIGGGWAARFALHGWNVRVYDRSPGAPRQVGDVVANARAAYPRLLDAPLPGEGAIEFAGSLQDAVTDADWIQESVPEDLAIKHAVRDAVEAAAPADAIIASSTSGFRPSQLREGAKHPQRIFVAHPFNPVYLLPLVEVVGGDRICTTLEAIGMRPLIVRKEIDAHIADRMLEAVWREALWLVHDDVATTAEIDDAIRFGFGLRWAQMGMFETYRLAGGEQGMAHFIEQFGPCLTWPWSKLTDVPEMTAEFAAKIGEQSDEQSGSRSVRELERIRDDNLVAIMRALKNRRWAAGAHLASLDERLAVSAPPTPAAQAAPVRLLELKVLPSWIDYNGHMTEWRYGQVFSDTCDHLLPALGVDAGYIARVGSYYTAETHIMYIDEVKLDEPIYTTSQIIGGDAKRLHLFNRIHAGADDRVLATAEQMYLHVDKQSGRVCAAADNVQERIRHYAEAHAALPQPTDAGRFVGQPRKR